MTDEHSTTPAPNDEGVTVQLRPVDCDAILAALEAALNAGLNFGPGLHTRNVEEAGRRIEAVADLARRGISASTRVPEEKERTMDDEQKFSEGWIGSKIVVRPLWMGLWMAYIPDELMGDEPLTDCAFGFSAASVDRRLTRRIERRIARQRKREALTYERTIRPAPPSKEEAG